jgi:hypothetical protein
MKRYTNHENIILKEQLYYYFYTKINERLKSPLKIESRGDKESRLDSHGTYPLSSFRFLLLLL